MMSVTDVVVIGAGQSGLAAARALLAHGIQPVVLEAGPEAAGSSATCGATPPASAPTSAPVRR